MVTLNKAVTAVLHKSDSQPLTLDVLKDRDNSSSDGSV